MAKWRRAGREPSDRLDRRRRARMHLFATPRADKFSNCGKRRRPMDGNLKSTLRYEARCQTRAQLIRSAPPCSTAASTSAFSPARPRASSCCSLTMLTTSEPCRIIAIGSRQPPHVPLLARVCAGRAAGPDLRLSGARAVRSGRGLRFDPTRCCSIRTAAASSFRRSYSREAAASQATTPRRR